MTWSKTLPTVSGWYWVRSDGALVPEVVLVAENLCVYRIDSGAAAFGVEFYKGDEWFGPLEPPPREMST